MNIDETKLIRSATQRAGTKADVYDKQSLMILCRQHGLSIDGSKNDIVIRLREKLNLEIKKPTSFLPPINQEEGKRESETGESTNISNEKLVERALSLPANIFLNLDTKCSNKNLNRKKHPLYSAKYNFASKNKNLYEACLDAATDIMYRYTVNIINHYQLSIGTPAENWYLNLDTQQLIKPIEAKEMHHSDFYRFATANERIFRLITTEEDHINIIAEGITRETEGAKMKVSNRSVSCGVRYRVWRKYNGNNMDSTCYCCNEALRLEDFEAGHVIAKRNSQNNEIANLRPICHLCNRSMGSTHMKEFAIKEGMEGRIIKDF